MMFPALFLGIFPLCIFTQSSINSSRKSVLSTKRSPTTYVKLVTQSLVGEIMSISAEVTKKARKSCQLDDADLISNLPESVICHILSRLPSKEAVQTSILSKDWEHKWTTTYNVDIIDWERFSKQRRKKPIFFNFMDKILLLSHDLKSFRLLYSRKYTNDRFMKWISAAFRRNIESFELQQHDQNCFVLPISLLNNNNSLRTLKLTCTLKVPRDNYFPHLTDLYLDEVEILNEQSNSDQLVFTFPVLKTFELIDCKWSNVELVEIYSPALCSFKCDRPFKFNKYWNLEVSDHVIKICGARLEKFESLGLSPENLILHESTVRNAALLGYPQRYYDVYGLQARELMKGFSNLAALELSWSLCEAIAQSKQELRLPEFDRLQRLVMCIGRNAKLLLELWHSAPSLKFLKLDGGSKEFDWAEVDFVPYCVTSHLREVVFSATSDKPLIHLAKFFLKNGLELKKVYIKKDRALRNAVVNRLKRFPKASAGAEIFPPGSVIA